MPRTRFVAYESLLIVLAFAVAAQVSPPDPLSQFASALAVLAATLPLSYWLAYKRR